MGCRFLKRINRGPETKPDTLHHLRQVNHIVGEENEYRSVVVVGLPPPTVGSWPTDGSHACASHQIVRVILQQYRYTQNESSSAGHISLEETQTFPHRFLVAFNMWWTSSRFRAMRQSAFQTSRSSIASRGASKHRSESFFETTDAKAATDPPPVFPKLGSNAFSLLRRCHIRVARPRVDTSDHDR
jgi:hypothetical protein